MVVRKNMQEEREYLPDVYPSVDQIERTQIGRAHV